MRLPKFLLLIFFITFIALVYVYQQTEIFYLAYSGAKKDAQLSDLLDKNSIFRYNINQLSSLTSLDSKILCNLDFEIPTAQQLVILSVGEDSIRINPESKRRTNLIFSFFGEAKQAQAQTLNRFSPQ